MIKQSLLTQREQAAIKKKLKSKKLTQQDSNYLSKYVRPKLREISMIDAKDLLHKLSYNQKALSIEKAIVKLIVERIANVKAIVLHGSAIHTNYKEYNDIDVLIIVKKPKKTLAEKYRQIHDLEAVAQKQELNLDIQVLSEATYTSRYDKDPGLIYQLQNSKVIYGNIKLPHSFTVDKLDLRMKLDYSMLDDAYSDGKDLYASLRNIILVKLLAQGIVDNTLLKEITISVLGKDMLNKLMTNTASSKDKKQVLTLIRLLESLTSAELHAQQWERKELSYH